ncbi:hypothetical protein BJY52DRAFT_952913 [Lactarius psammicola]|nr:hypothetical protein BJY52DRAFT_952913 [Lactarius psammicola]
MNFFFRTGLALVTAITRYATSAPSELIELTSSFRLKDDDILKQLEAQVKRQTQPRPSQRRAAWQPRQPQQYRAWGRPSDHHAAQQKLIWSFSNAPFYVFVSLI